ncbi:S24 family peptidase [Aquipseudomonas campi]
MEKDHSGTRLRSLLEERKIPFVDFASTLGLPAPQNIHNWWTRGVPKGKVRNVCALLKINQEWLEDGVMPIEALVPSRTISADAVMEGPIEVWDDDTPLPDDEVLVPFLKEVELAAGSGRMSVEVNTKRRLRFGKYSLRNKGVDPANARCVTITGNSMEPVLRNGATVGVDVGNTRIIDGDLYAINHSGQLRVKQAYRLPGGGLRLRSFNRDEHPDEEYSLGDIERQEIAVIGRVFWGAMFF